MAPRKTTGSKPAKPKSTTSKTRKSTTKKAKTEPDLADRLDEVLDKPKQNDDALDVMDVMELGSRAVSGYRIGEECAKDPAAAFGLAAALCVAAWRAYQGSKKQ